MNNYDYITKEDIDSLTKNEYDSLRNYLRFAGNKVSDIFGLKQSKYIKDVIMLVDGDLLWRVKSTTESLGGDRISLEEVKRMASLGRAAG